MTGRPHKSAIRVEYQPMGKAKAEYYFWKAIGGGNKWYWVAMGNNGEEATEEAARRAAKDWINGHSPIIER